MRTVRKAFTLVEILIVVVILGILAAIVVPQFTSATRDAQGGNIQSQLETLNSQSELFRAKYNVYPFPTAANPWADDITLPDGRTLEGGLIGLGYLKSAPRNPFNNSSTIGTAADNGWIWATATVNGREIGQWFGNYLNNDPEDNDPTDGDGVFGQVLDGAGGSATFKLPAGFTEAGGGN